MLLSLNGTVKRLVMVAAIVMGLVCVDAYTPPGFQPASSANLTVILGGLLATNGALLPRDTTASPPLLYTTQPLTGTYALMMVDPDIPSVTSNLSATSELLHWLQPGLVSSLSPSTISGSSQPLYQLLNPNNISAYASYLQPTPPFKIPYSHQYTELLLDTTSMPNNSILATFAKNRTGFDAVKVVQNAGVRVVAGNWFNVTNAMALGNASATSSGSAGPATVTTSGAGAVRVGVGAWMAWVGAASLSFWEFEGLGVGR